MDWILQRALNIILITCFIAGSVIVTASANRVSTIPDSTPDISHLFDISSPLDIKNKEETIGKYSSVYIDGKLTIYSVSDVEISAYLNIQEPGGEPIKDGGEIIGEEIGDKGIGEIGDKGGETTEFVAITDESNSLKYDSKSFSIQYQGFEDGLKESITVYDPASLPSGFSLSLFGGALQENKDGTISIMDMDNNAVVLILKPYAIDAKENRYELEYRVNDNSLEFVGLDTMKDAAYPIIIDPTYKVVSGTGTDAFNAPPRGRKTARDSNGRLWIIWKGAGSIAGRYVPIWASYSDNNGSTWTHLDATVDTYPSMYSGLTPRFDTTSSSLSNTTAWEYFDTARVNKYAVGFMGVASDATHVYYGPAFNMYGNSGHAVRYDTSLPFTSVSSWDYFNMTSVDQNMSFMNVVYPNTNSVYYTGCNNALGYISHIAKYDSTGAFDNFGSWSYFDTRPMSGNTMRCINGLTSTDGYLYTAPYYNGTFDGNIVRYNEAQPFTSASSWEWYSLEKVNTSLKGFVGGTASQPGVVYWLTGYTGAFNGLVAKYNTTLPFTSASSYSFFNVTTLNSTMKGYMGGTISGDYLYLAPSDNGVKHGMATRYNTTRQFTSASSWEYFDMTKVDPRLKGFSGVAAHGNYIFYSPSWNGMPDYSGVVARYDSTMSFTDPAAWNYFDLTSINPDLKGFYGETAAGIHVYYAPYTNVYPEPSANHFQDGLLDSKNNLYVFWRGPSVINVNNIRMRMRDAVTGLWGSVENLTSYGWDISNSPRSGVPGVNFSSRPASYPACAINSSDYIHCIYSGLNASPNYLTYPNIFQIGYTYRNPSTGTWSTPELMTNAVAGTTQSVGSIAIDGQDTVHIAWTGDQYLPNLTGISAVYRYKPLSGGWNSTEVLWNAGSGVTGGVNPVLVVNSSNFVHVVYAERVSSAQNMTIYLQTRNPVTTTWTDPKNVTPVSVFYNAQQPSIAIDASDNITITSSELNPLYARGPSQNLFVRNITISTGQISEYSKLTFETASNKAQRETHLFNTRWPVIDTIVPSIPATGYMFAWLNLTGSSTGEVWFYSSNDISWQTKLSANFTANRSGDVGVPLQPILFTDTSTGSPTNWNYTATALNGTIINLGTMKDTTYEFNRGNWSVSLNISTGYGYNISLSPVWINVSSPYGPLVASFVTNRSGNLGMEPQPVLVVNTSSGNPDAWNYTALELNSTVITLSTNPDFEHSFVGGNWSLSLRISDLYGYDISDQTTWINVTTLVPTPTPVPTTPNPFDVATPEYMSDLIQMVIMFGIGLLVLAVIAKVFLSFMFGEE